ncbi:uncharacterized protein PGTG_02773 [Puccinia graminis f. sp. tritici CRL 75-36-700-3]|uniref:Uncharacterized protein n=1 Tax=Puccinia graminis f. sp. tritici (strain CRL 75-36-700-3 / race SCCL) TaxID=418459 RepID=E3JWA7_PUCGT|nr:uncharacterized protein PGTG_02773 [Puccinia graminis f. sp. tritici CRL 75-36-700-3]EFP76332.1 hypothetical protein PGTG_02773 [Puccinia graminis f. sp. tritici CRL 75-36-700-3]
MADDKRLVPSLQKNALLSVQKEAYPYQWPITVVQRILQVEMIAKVPKLQCIAAVSSAFKSSVAEAPQSSCCVLNGLSVLETRLVGPSQIDFPGYEIVELLAEMWKGRLHRYAHSDSKQSLLGSELESS